MKKHIFILLLCFLSLTTFSQKKAITRATEFNLEKKIAIQGYDPVSYFKGKPTKGKVEFATTYEGVIYYFSTKENKDNFLKNPIDFEPQYGGWCAYAMGNSGEKVEIDPKTFKIINGKLYLFYNAYFNNTLKSWSKDESNLKQKADTNWDKIIK